MIPASDAFLKARGVEASALNSTTILFRREPSRSAVYEELFHVKQFQEGKIDGTVRNAYENEIEAQEYLLKNAAELKLTQMEIEQTKDALEWYILKLNDLKGDDWDDNL